MEQNEIAAVKERQKEKREDDRQLVDVKRIDQRHHRTPKRKMPENGWYHELLASLASEPLNEEAAREQKVAKQSESSPPWGVDVEPWQEPLKPRTEEDAFFHECRFFHLALQPD